MKETNVYTKIITDENLMETIPHGSQDYPFRYYYEHLAQFDFNCIDCAAISSKERFFL